MKNNLNNKTVRDLIKELETNQKIIEKALKEFQGRAVIINTSMDSSVNSSILIHKLDWTYLVGFNGQIYMYISEWPFESNVGTNLIFDVDNSNEVEYSKNNLRVWFQNGFSLYISVDLANKNY